MPKRVVIVTGEASGDQHAATLVRALKVDYPEQQFEFTGIGGPQLQKEGVQLLGSLDGITGITEVLRHLLKLYRTYKNIQEHLSHNPPDLLILVDYPGFNLRLAKFAKTKLKLKILYYISPQIWAWKAGRIHNIRKHIDHMAVILPFEKPLYDQAQVPCSFVGHPILESIAKVPNPIEARQQLNLPLQQRIVAFLPGSRKNEIKQHLPVLNRAAALLLARMPDLTFVIPIASSLSREDLSQHLDPQLPIQLVQAQALPVMAAADAVVVASGTASLECALLEKPMCIIYKASRLTYIAATQLMKVQYLGLCNLIANRMIVPELMQYECNPVTLTETVDWLLNDPVQRQAMIQNLKKIKAVLSSHQADQPLSQLVYQQVNVQPTSGLPRRCAPRKDGTA